MAADSGKQVAFLPVHKIIPIVTTDPKAASALQSQEEEKKPDRKRAANSKAAGAGGGKKASGATTSVGATINSGVVFEDDGTPNSFNRKDLAL